MARIYGKIIRNIIKAATLKRNIDKTISLYVLGSTEDITLEKDRG